jgi:hypothetical protein
VPFAAANSLVSFGPKGLRVENGSGWVITSRIRVQPNDEVVVALPFPCSYAAEILFSKNLAVFFFEDAALPEGDSSSYSNPSSSVSSLAVFFNALLPLAFATLFLFPQLRCWLQDLCSQGIQTLWHS